VSHLLTQAEILALLAPEARSYLEVGVQEGRSLGIVLDAGRSIRRVLLCDSWGNESGGSGRGNHDHIDRLLDGWPGRLAFLDGDSRETLPNVESDPYDLVHIDGGHGYDVVISDLRHGWRLCAAAMVVHDIAFPEVWRAFCDFAGEAEGLTVGCYFGGHGTAVVRRAP
jgi:hypothetical protein